jgi:hypothetical protein
VKKVWPFVILLLVAVIGGGLWFAWRAVPRAIATNISTPKETQVDLTTVVTRVRGLNRLETATMRVVHVSTISQSYEYVPNALAGDTLQFLATGDVIAGIDLAGLGAGDLFRRSDGTVVMRLPPPQVLVTRVDNRESRVLQRTTGMFRKADPGLEGRARLYAESGIRNEAVKRGILTLAQRNAEARLGELLHGAGIERLEFVESTPQAAGQ